MIDFPTGTTGQIFTSGTSSWRYDGTKWLPYSATVESARNVGRNYIHNSMFNIAQRGNGPFNPVNAGIYSADRWMVIAVADTLSSGIFIINDASRTAIGEEAAQQGLSMNVTGTAGASALSLYEQKIEDAHRLGGKTVTVSFWAAAGVAGLKLGVSLDQDFGTGGSPSAAVQGAGQQIASLTTQFVRYTLTFNIPSIAGKTFGTNNNSSTWLNIWVSSGATNNTRAGGIGVQSGAVYLWGVQLEIGSAATPLEKPDPQQDLAKCQRFYTVLTLSWAAYNAAAGSMVATYTFPVTMRASPTMVYTNQSYFNATNVANYAVNASALTVQATVTATGTGNAGATAAASADL